MVTQRPLDEFLDSQGEEPPSVEPIRSTYKWDGEGTDCRRCGERNHRFWTEDGALVCVDCKEW